MPKGVNDGRGCFIGLRKDQLGARLLMMLNSIRLAQDYNTTFQINWFPRGAAAPKLDTPSDLFDQGFIERHFIKNDAFEALDPLTKPIWAFQKDKSADRLEAHLAQGGHVLLDEGFEIVEFPWENGSTLRGRFRGFIDQIEFNSAVRKHIDEIETVMAQGNGKVIAYHIRRGDILNEEPWKHKEWPAKIEPDELYAAYLEKNADAGALVFSDQPESIARFTVNNNHVKSIDDLVDLSDCKPVQRDFLELYSMSRASEIVAPPISAFSRAAARLNGEERKCFHEVMSVEDRSAAYQTVTERFQKGISEFITPSEAAHIFFKLSRHLQEQGREAEAWDIGQSILNAGADNAFLPLTHATNGIYLHKWHAALANIDAALAHPAQWRENYISALALRAHVLGALGKRFRARRSFLQAFWQKPMLPDVTVVGSFMIRRGQLKPGVTLPFDRETIMALPIPYHQTNIVLQQSKILKRRALDLSTIAIEWPWFAMDGKMRRRLDAVHELAGLQERLRSAEGFGPGAGPFSFCALLDLRMGRNKAALKSNQIALEHAPDDPLLHKRQAEILMYRGDYLEALKHMKTCMDLAPKHPFWHFMNGLIRERAGQMQAARASFEQAADMDNCTAELHAHLAGVCEQAGDKRAAIAALERAADIAPNQQRYRNQRDRMAKKLK